jgi:hypothetical protein
MIILYLEGNRDQFDSRRIADRLERATTRTAFGDRRGEAPLSTGAGFAINVRTT